MNKEFFLNTFYRFYKVFIMAVVAVSFFSFYNMFLIDQTLEGLRYSLEETVRAYDIRDVDGLDMLISKAISKEIAPRAIKSRASIVHLEFANSIIESGKSFRQLGHMKVALNTAIREKEKERGTVLTFFDRLNRPVREGVLHLGYLVRTFFKPKPLPPEIEVPLELDLDLFEEFRLLGKGKNLQELMSNYSNFIASYPEYGKIGLVKLRLAYTYQRLGEYGAAIDLYREIEKEYATKKEAKIAQVFLVTLEKKNTLLKKINGLLIRSREISTGDAEEKQKIFYDIGMVYMELFNMKEAAKFFSRAVSVNPGSHMATKSQYNAAWLARQNKDYETSQAMFSQLISENPGDDLVFDSLYQMGAIYHAGGNYEKFVELALRLADDYKQYPVIASLCLFQAGVSYMYDLNDPEKANEIFARLLKEYPGTPYAQYLAPVSPAGVFIAYLVPRATRVVAWRVMGLLCLSGYQGEIFKFTAESEEAGFNLAFNNWLKQELPDTLGNLYVDIKGHETQFTKDKAKSQARITMGQFNVLGRAEWKLGVTEGKTLDLMVTKAFLERVPLPPVLLNNSLRGIKRIIEKNFPIQITEAYVSHKKAGMKGFGTKAVLERMKHDMETLFMAEFKIEEIEDARERQSMYNLFSKKFPEGDFSVRREWTDEEIFLDFFTRISLYSTFKILETVKDSKLDFERSIRTLGRLMLKEENFRVDFKEDRINVDIARFVQKEFPWLIDDKFYVDIKSLKVDFKDTEEIEFEGQLNLGYGDSPQALKVRNIDVEGRMTFEIDEESGIPRWLFKEISLNDRPFFLLDKINMLTLRCLNMLKDENIPLNVADAKPYDGGMVFRGKGAGDFTARLFYDPHPFVIFHIRGSDLKMAGLKRINRPGDGAMYFRGRTYKKTLTPAEKNELKQEKGR